MFLQQGFEFAHVLALSRHLLAQGSDLQPSVLRLDHPSAILAHGLWPHRLENPLRTFVHGLLCVLMVTSVAAQEFPALAQVYAPHFKFGFGGLNDKVVRAGLAQSVSPIHSIVTQQSNILGINCFYPAQVHPKEGVYRWSDCEPLMAYADQYPNKMRRGHVLFWPSNDRHHLEWLLSDSDGKPVTRAQAIEKLRNHVQTIVGRYRGRIQYWDVVNEAIDPQQADGLRAGRWKDLLGEEMLDVAFSAAREADPQAKLFYNDFQEWRPGKRERIFALVQRLKAKGLIDGIGLQQHVSLTEPSVAELDQTLARFAQLGLEIHITELDVEANRNGQLSQITPELDAAIAQRYRALFDVYMKYAGKITAVMNWNVTDASSWLRNHPTPHATWPLLFDADGKPKAAFWALTKP